MPVIAQDSFELGTAAAAPPPPWVTHVPTGGTVAIDTDPAAGAARGKVLKIAEGTGSTADYAEAKLPFPRAFDKLCVVVEFYAGQASKTLYFGFYSGATRYDVLKLASDANYKYKNASGVWTNVGGAAYSTGTWTRLRFVLDRTAAAAELVAVTVSDIDRATALDLQSIPTDLDSFALATDSTEDNATFWVNDVMVLEKTALVFGTIRDQGRAPISGARVVMVRQATGVQLGAVLTDANGIYRFSAADAGLYADVIAYHPTLNTYGGSGVPWLMLGAA